MKSFISWNKGKTGVYSVETIKKMSESAKGNRGNTGRKFSIEHREKISKALKGRPKSEEHKRKQSETMRGRPGQKGEKHSQWKGGISKTKEYRYKKTREWLIRNPEWHMSSWRKRYALKRNSIGTFTTQEWTVLKESTQYMCLCCKRKEPEIKLEADHIFPLSLGGENTIKNIQPLCRSCNARKNNKNIDYLSIYQLKQTEI